MSSHIRVLIIEDSEDDSTLLARELKRGGFEVTFVERVNSSAAMALALDKQDWDLVVCDYSMPNFSGDEALEILKGRGLDIPFIFVSGTIGEDRAVAALKQGAHDYVMKQNLKRLVPAIQRELRETDIRRERSRMQQKIQQLERFEAIGQLAGGIAHDFNNVIGAIQGWAHLGYEEATEGSRARARFLRIRDQAQRAAGLTAQLLAFARRQVLQPRNMSLNDLISETLGFLRSTIGEHIETQAILDPDLRVVCADSTQIQQVLMNLCFNARDAMLEGGRLFIKTENADLTNEFNRVHSYGIPGEYALLSVSDTGIGMDKATMERAFEPFFTTKEVGKGTGLGLATVYGIVKQHGGFVNVYSERGRGTTFRVYLPASAGEVEVPKPATPQAVEERGTETVLVAEDDPSLRDLARESLVPQGYRIILAKNGQDALELFEKRQQEINIVLLDVVMPGMSGPDVYSAMLAIRPNLPVVFTTGHTSEAVSLHSKLEAGAVFLPKPYTLQALRQAIRTALDRSKTRGKRDQVKARNSRSNSFPSQK